MLRAIRLPEASKARMRAELSSYADLHAVQDAVEARRGPSTLSVLMLRTRSLYAGALALVLVIAGGTQASMAAENALPGDVLYPLKVEMAEPIALALTVSPERKAELSARFASRRVAEAAVLSSAGRLDDRAVDELADRFDTHVAALAKETDALEAKGDIAVSLAVRTDLEQKLTDGASSIAIASAPAADTQIQMMKTVAAADAQAAPEARFSARVFEKSRTLATTRERLDSALALDTEAQAGDSVDLAVLRHPGAGAAPAGDSAAVLFFAKAPADAASGAAGSLASTTATTTATTSSPELPAGSAETAPASRFFSPFRSR